MSSPPEQITITCPKCQKSFDTWHRASMNLQLDNFDEEYIREATVKTCPHCGVQVHLESLIVGKDGVWQIGAVEVQPFWIATHDPHDADDNWYIYLKRQQRAGGLPSKGHKVLFYETAKVGPDGHEGRKALVCASEVIGDLRDRTPPKGKWRYEIPCGAPEEASKAVGPDQMLSALGLPTTPLVTWRGLKNISESQYAKLRELMGLSRHE